MPSECCTPGLEQGPFLAFGALTIASSCIVWASWAMAMRMRMTGRAAGRCQCWCSRPLVANWIGPPICPSQHPNSLQPDARVSIFEWRTLRSDLSGFLCQSASLNGIRTQCYLAMRYVPEVASDTQMDQETAPPTRTRNRISAQIRMSLTYPCR